MLTSIIRKSLHELIKRAIRNHLHSVITGIAVVPGIFTDYLVMIGFAVVLVAFLRSGIIPRPAGIGLAIAYAVYLGYTLLL